MKRCSFCEWIPILPLPVWPLAGHARLGQNTVVGSMTVLLVLLGSIPRKSMAGPPFSLQANLTTVEWGATLLAPCYQNRVLIPALANAISGQACQWYTALAARVFVYH